MKNIMTCLFKTLLILCMILVKQTFGKKMNALSEAKKSFKHFTAKFSASVGLIAE